MPRLPHSDSSIDSLEIMGDVLIFPLWYPDYIGKLFIEEGAGGKLGTSFLRPPPQKKFLFSENRIFCLLEVREE